MSRTTAGLAAVTICVVSSTAFALYSVDFKGTWPKSWPAEMEALRNQARTLVGPEVECRHFAIPFTNREQFESAWPHILKVKSNGAPVFLVRGPNFFLGEKTKAGVVVHCPPEGQINNPATPEAPIRGVTEPRMRWMNTKFVELVVDGDVVDLNRIPLPSDTPIIDERFEERASPSEKLTVADVLKGLSLDESKLEYIDEPPGKLQRMETECTLRDTKVRVRVRIEVAYTSDLFSIERKLNPKAVRAASVRKVIIIPVGADNR